MSGGAGAASPWLWWEGELQPLEAAQRQRCRALEAAGHGVLETLRVEGGRALRFECHRARLFRSLRALGLPAPPAPQLVAALRALLARAQGRDGLARVVVTERRWWATLEPPRPVAPRAERGGLALAIAPGLARERTAREAGHKSTARAAWRRARERAVAAGAWDALLLDRAGRVCETTVANVFWRTGDTLFTPALDLGILPGVARAAVLEFVAARRWRLREVAAPLASLLEAEEVVVTNALIEAVPVDRIGAHRVPRCPGEAGAAIAAALAARPVEALAP